MLVVVATITPGAVASGDVFDSDTEFVTRGEQMHLASCGQCHCGPGGRRISDIPPRHCAQGHTWHHACCPLADIVLDGLSPRQGVSDNEIMSASRDERTNLAACTTFTARAVRLWNALEVFTN